MYAQELEAAGPYPYDLWVCRRDSLISPVLDLIHVDLTGATLQCDVRLLPDAAGGPLTSLDVGLSVAALTYQELVDQCRLRKQDLPCGVSLSDTTPVSSITVTGSSSKFTNLPRAQVMGERASFYYAIRQISPINRTLIAGQFHIVETA